MIKKPFLLAALLVLAPLAARAQEDVSALLQRQTQEMVDAIASPDVAYEIRRTADGLEGQQTGRKWEAMKAEAPDVLFIPGKPRYRWIFRRGAEGRITGLIERREAWDLDWTRK